MKKNTHLRERGFTLIELMIVLGIGSLVFMNFIQMEQKRQESISAENAGGQLYEVGQALAQFINMNNSVLQTAVPQGTTTTTPIPLSAMQSSSGTTTIGGVAVPNRLLLPQTYDNRLGFPTVLPVTYSIYLRNNAGTVTGLIITNTGILDKSGATRYDWTGIAMKKAGAQAGVVFGSPTQINGLNGIWALTNSDYPAINTLGQVAYRVAYQATYDSTYLRLDGMYPMIGNLNMGNYSIKNASDISYTGWLYGNNAVMNNLVTGTITNAGNITTQSINGKSTALTSANAANYSNSVSPTASYANFDNFYANCINCGFPSDTGTANISTKFNAANGDVRIGAGGNSGTLFVKDVILGGNGGYVPPTVIHLPTSYGAVALDLKTNTYGYSSKQASEQASKQAALADCGKKGCKVFHTYSNSCTAMAYGWVSGRGNFFMIGDENIQLAQQKALGNCQSQYGNCEIVMSECSLAGQTDGR